MTLMETAYLGKARAAGRPPRRFSLPPWRCGAGVVLSRIPTKRGATPEIGWAVWGLVFGLIRPAYFKSGAWLELHAARSQLGFGKAAGRLSVRSERRDRDVPTGKFGPLFFWTAL